MFYDIIIYVSSFICDWTEVSKLIGLLWISEALNVTSAENRTAELHFNHKKKSGLSPVCFIIREYSRMFNLT